MNFSQLGLLEPLLKAVEASGYSTPTPIQAQAIPIVISGRDLLGTAQTGTGKTAAFALPVIHRLLASGAIRPAGEAPEPVPAAEPRDEFRSHRRDGQFRQGDRRRDWRQNDAPRQRLPFRPVRVLVLSPTRELALQIGQSFETYAAHTDLRYVTVFGGVNQYHQVQALRTGMDVLVATPGRLEDLFEQGHMDLSKVEILVLDEADRMLDMGFMPAIQRIVKLIPQDRQTLFFSATMPPEVRALSENLLRDPAQIAIAPEAPAAVTVEQCVYMAEKPQKTRLLRHFLCRPEVSRSIVFTRTKHGADRLERVLRQADFRVEAIHSNRTQFQRQKALAAFKRGLVDVLIATDIASRGIDVDGITHVFNFDLPEDPESYVHRIGRTGRAGASGLAVAFCSGEERGRLKGIERLLGRRLDRMDMPEQFLEYPQHHLKQNQHHQMPESAQDVAASDDDGFDDEPPRRGRFNGNDRQDRPAGGQDRSVGQRHDRPTGQHHDRPAGQRQDRPAAGRRQFRDDAPQGRRFRDDAPQGDQTEQRREHGHRRQDQYQQDRRQQNQYQSDRRRTAESGNGERQFQQRRPPQDGPRRRFQQDGPPAEGAGGAEPNREYRSQHQGAPQQGAQQRRRPPQGDQRSYNGEQQQRRYEGEPAAQQRGNRSSYAGQQTQSRRRGPEPVGQQQEEHRRRPPKPARRPPVVAKRAANGDDAAALPPEIKTVTASGRPVYLGHIVTPTRSKRPRRAY